MGNNDLYKYVVYKPKGGDARVKAAWEEIYFCRGIEAMYAAVDTYLVDTTWIPQVSWKNDSAVEQQYNIEYKTELWITQGKEVNNGFSVAAVYKGMSVIIERQEKVFGTTETRTIPMTVTIPPRSRLIFYQRRYRFKNDMFFIHDARGREWNVGSWGGDVVLKKECTVVIFSEEYAILENELDGSCTGTMDVVTVANVLDAKAIIKREDCTGRCKGKLDDMRIY